MKKAFVYTAFALVMVACNKDNFETKPTLKFKSTNGNLVPQQGTLSATLEFTDKEGDLATIYVVRQRLNARGREQTPAAPYPIPEFNKEQKGEVVVNLDYSFGLTFNLQAIRITGSNPIQNERDTLQLKFVVQDKEGNVSDTATSGIIYVTR